ncbi:MAG TPA: glycosyltransferase family 2 protein [Chthoniobacteraceae bacterium]|jgi:glycosyltransferase involved in cell wall biosynthesis|nr:glycosyltransferase family 2 protein [Chthoniobacteraceae bacterium]
MSRKLLSIITPCYNEEENVEELHRLIDETMSELVQYDWEHIYIDNCSRDGTTAVLRRLAATDPRVKVILNARNFGHIRSPFHAILQVGGDAAVTMASDLQDPPELIRQFIEKWEQGYKVVLGQKITSDESPIFFTIRTTYYKLVRKLADIELIEHVTGFGLYDREVVEQFRKVNDPYPYTRGLVSDLGYDVARIPYHQPLRKRGITKNNFYTLYDMAMLGITSHSKVPLRLATLLGFALALCSLLIAFGYLIYKLVFWDRFPVGQAPVVIGLFLFSSVQLFFTGVLGEYIAAIHTQVLHRPLVVEKERINF